MIPVSFADTWYWLALGALLSYLLGCFNFAVLISKIKALAQGVFEKAPV